MNQLGNVVEKQKKFLGLEEAVLFETRKEGHCENSITTGYVPNRETEEVGRER